MKLSQSVQFMSQKTRRNKSSNIRKNTESQQNIRKNEISQPISILIKIGKYDQLEPSFVDTFSKALANNLITDFMEVKETTYIQFYQTIKNLGNHLNNTKHWIDFNRRYISSKEKFKKAKSYENIRRGSVDLSNSQPKKNYIFNFQAHNNSIILLLDLSPYMLMYDYSTKSFVLQNMQQIVKNLIAGLQRHCMQRKNGNSMPSYFVSCYAFSIYNEQIEQIMRQQQIFFSETATSKFRNIELISDYICACISRSKMPHSNFDRENISSISQVIQKVLNLQEGSSGIKSFITISAFKQLDSTPYIFFSSNWYTYCFICAGELNFGSYIIDCNQIVNLFSKSPYLETKYVYKCKFLQNWQKVKLIQKGNKKYEYIDTSLQKSRAILYINCSGQKKQSIFQDILKFTLKMNDRRTKIQGTQKSNESVTSFTKAQKMINQYQFSIPAQNIAQIMRTKYLQGWEQISTQNYPQNTKYVFKLQFANRTGIIYNATRTEDCFVVKISLSSGSQSNSSLEKTKNERKRIIQTIKKIDMINTSNFNIVTAFKNKNTQSNCKLKTAKNYKIYVNFDSRGEEGMNMLDEIMAKHNEWSCYFKVKKIYIHFTPNSHFLNDLDQMLNEFRFLFGERISQYCFMHRKQNKQKLVDHIKEREISKWNIIFVKVSGIMHFLEFKFGFLQYTDIEIRQHIQNISNKLVSKKLINGSIKLIPEDVYGYCAQNFIQSNIKRKSLSSVFEKNWKIGFKNQVLLKIFKFINKKIIKKIGYNFLVEKNNKIYYYKIVNLVQKQGKRDKGIFLQVKNEQNNSLTFKIEAFPTFIYTQNMVCSSKQVGSEKTIYYPTSKSISSSSSQYSITANSLPASPFTAKDLISNKTGQSQPQSKYKNSFLELFNLLAVEIKESQKRYINLTKYEAQIFDFLVKKRLQQKKSGIQDEQLIQKIKQIYRISGQNFQMEYYGILTQTKRQQFSDQSHQININKSYASRRYTVKNVNQLSLNSHVALQVNIDQILEPKEFLMQSSIFNIKGDLTLTSKTNPQKKYIFFLLTPNRAMYIWKKPNSERIKYRMLENVYSHLSAIFKEESELRKQFEKELIGRINKQLKQEQYLTFYNIIAQQNQNDVLQLLTLLSSKKKFDKLVSSRNLVDYSEEAIKSFTGVSMDCRQITALINKQQNFIVQQRMLKVLIQFKNKFFQYLSLFFEKSKLKINDQIISSEIEIKKSKTQQILQKQVKPQFKKYVEDKAGGKSQGRIQLKFINIQKSNNYYFQKKSFESTQNFNQANLENYPFENMILKICTNKGVFISQYNFLQLFRKDKKSPYEMDHLQIHLDFFGFKSSKNSPKIQWLNQILQQLLAQCILYLNVISVKQSNDIKEVENRLSDYIVKGPAEKLTDDLWNEGEIIRQIQSGHMRSVLPFYQYSFKPFPAKFIVRQSQSLIQTFSSAKNNQVFYLKFWLTMELTPSKVLKTRLIPFKHLSLATEIILNMFSGDCKGQMEQMINSYIAELLTFLKVRNIFKAIQHKLMFPENPAIPIFINFSILKKLEEEKKKHSKNKIPKKFKSQTKNYGYPALQLKSLSSVPQTESGFNSSFIESSTPLTATIGSNNLNDQQANLKNFVKLSLIYQGSLNYFPKFQPEEVFSLLACCEKLNPYAIRNLENTYIFFNPQIKQYIIFFLEESSQPLAQPQIYTPLVRQSSKIKKNTDEAIKIGQNQRSKSFIMSPNNANSPPNDKKKNNTLIYSVYCIDKTVSKATIQKYHGQLFKKALDQVTFYKIGKTLFLSPSIIDEPEEQYFMDGEKRLISFEIPQIEQKSNLKQYIKQHIQAYLNHKKTDFKSYLKKKQLERQNQQQQMKDSKNKIDAKKPRNNSGTYSSECDHRCSPQTWIFNTFQSQIFQQNFGKCMFLAQLGIHDNYSSAENAIFWHRHIKDKQQKGTNKDKKYIYPQILSSQRNESSHELQIIKYLRLYDQKQFRQRKHSKSSINKSLSSITNSSSTFGTTISIHTGQSPKKSQAINQTKIVEFLLQKHAQNENNQRLTFITFNILSAFGFPKYKMLEHAYKEIIYYSVFDYFVQNRLFKLLFANFNITTTYYRKNNCFGVKRLKSGQKQIIGPTKQAQDHTQEQLYRSHIIPLQRVESSPIKNSVCSKQSFILLYNDQFVNQIYQSFLNFFQTIEKDLPLKKTTCFNSYFSQKKLLIQSKIPILASFIKHCSQVFNRNAKSMDKYPIRLILYGVDKNYNKTHFWGLQYQKVPRQKDDKKCKYAASLEEIDQEIARYRLQFFKMGLFFCDSLLDIDSLRQSFFFKDQNSQSQNSRQWQTFNRLDKMNIEYQWMKKFQQGHSFCQTEFYFRRSLFLHFQVTQTNFLFFSYNLKDKQVECLFNCLEELESWFHEKYRLYTFIVKLRKHENESQQYQVPARMQIGSSHRLPIGQPFFLLKQSSQGSKTKAQQSMNQVDVNLTKLLKSLVFDELPFKNFKNSKSAIDRMYKILAYRTINDYKSYPQYQGKQKSSKLAKIGRQYMSILRYYFGVQKVQRKQSLPATKQQKSMNAK